MKILLFGSTGAFGTGVESVCAKRNIECIGLTHSDIEITKPEEIRENIEKYEPDVVVNAVGFVGVNPCEKEPVKAFSVNSICVSNLAKICKEKDIIFVQPSSHAVFNGKKQEGFYTEDDMPNPLNIYAVTKHNSEHFAKLCKKHYILRFPTLFGKRRNNSMGFVDKVISWIKEGKELKIADDKIDTYGYTIDLANLLIDMLEQKKPYGIYHLANSGKASYYDFVLELIRLLGTDTIVHKAKDKDFPSALGAEKPACTPSKSIKLEPIRSWQEALAEYVENEVKLDINENEFL